MHETAFMISVGPVCASLSLVPLQLHENFKANMYDEI
jgi:hypothetical protein